MLHKWFDLEAGVQKTINFISEAGEKGCKLIGFPEVCKLTRSKGVLLGTSDLSARRLTVVFCN